MPATLTFTELLESLTHSGNLVREDPELKAYIATLVAELHAQGAPSRETLAAFVQNHPESVVFLASCVGLGKEQLLNQLQHLARVSGWVKLARTEPQRLIALLDDHFGLVDRVAEELSRNWTFSDVLLERQLWSRKTARGAVTGGRKLEDAVEAVVRSVIGDRYEMRTRFLGRGGETAPCDLAIPAGGKDALIVVAIKSFASTGSKQGDAVNEIAAMGHVRLPRQFVYAVVDGIGWRRRRRDLQRIYELWQRDDLNGVFTLAFMDLFAEQLREAASILRLIDGRTG